MFKRAAESTKVKIKSPMEFLILGNLMSETLVLKNSKMTLISISVSDPTESFSENDRYDRYTYKQCTSVNRNIRRSFVMK